MSKKMETTELVGHCETAIASLAETLKGFSSAPADKIKKRAMLIAYWIKSYVYYLKNEDGFSPQSVFRLKRGSVVQVEFGYRVGRELGGRHYATVIDVSNALGRNTVSVVPLGSVKEEKPDNRYGVLLEDGIYGSVNRKLNALIEEASRTTEEAKLMEAEIQSATAGSRPSLKAVQRQKLESAKNLLKQAQIWTVEISHMSRGSVAKVDQITTISKMRISQPLQKTHPLYGIRLTNKDMDKIDVQLQRLYFPPTHDAKET